MDRQLAELTQARATMASTLAEWDARLAATPDGTPARLLETLPAEWGGRKGEDGGGRTEDGLGKA